MKHPVISAPDRLAPEALNVHLQQTPFLLMDLDRVVAAYRQFTELLPAVTVHYAMKCNPDQRILQALHQAGCSFEIASYAELEELMAIGVDPAGVLFSNPVKMPSHITRSYQDGLRIYSFDSHEELRKIADNAPGGKVNVRLRTRPADSLVASEGKFGVDADQAYDLMTEAAALGLQPHGIAFHVGSQMHDPTAWSAAVQQSAALMRRLQTHDITIKLLDIGGGFPAHYADAVPPLSAFADAITAALADHLPYQVSLACEPGRALVGDAGVMVATVIGIAERAGTRWVHIDVGAFNGMMEALETANELRFPVADSRQSTDTTLSNLTGPSCDSQDTILFGVPLSQDLAVGDRVYIYTAGAYTTSYASRFNGFDLPSVHTV